MTWPLVGICMLILCFSSLVEVRSDSLCTEKIPTKRNESNCNAYCNSRWGKAALVNKPWAIGRCQQDKDVNQTYCTCRFNDKDLNAFFPTKCIATGTYAPLSTKKALADEEYQNQVSQMTENAVFDLYIKAYQKKYRSKAEKRNRFNIFKANLGMIKTLNDENRRRGNPGNLLFGIGPFTDLTSDEYVSYMGFLEKSPVTVDPIGQSLAPRMLDSFRKSKNRGSGSTPRRERSNSPAKTPKRSKSRDRKSGDQPGDDSKSRGWWGRAKDDPKSRSRSKDESTSRFRSNDGSKSRGRSEKNDVSNPKGRSSSVPVKSAPPPLSRENPSRSQSAPPVRRRKRDRLWVGMDLPPDPSSDPPPQSPPERVNNPTFTNPTHLDEPEPESSSSTAASTSRGRVTPWIGKDPEGDPEMDWRDPADIYPEPRNQVLGEHRCRSCWAFAVLGAVEIHWALDENKVTQLSAQDLVDCVEGNSGCAGGNVDVALKHMFFHGVSKEEDYPYKAVTGECNKRVKRYLKIEDFERVKTRKQIEDTVVYSPLPTSLHSPKELQHYVSGIYNSDNCSNDANVINHAATIVGHYEEAWIVRNSAGPNWGLQGHYLVEKGKCGIGIDTYAVYSPYEIEDQQ
ncbi:unnamed protein product [Bemisia tabaci]|uniref:Uncharacterized protein n=1 Tax=Bemisia tabaci TaxID=7038 RepID=A0A9P0AQJ6_BEMTA|nr:unnamed protein product [Bemisia tabaci]